MEENKKKRVVIGIVEKPKVSATTNNKKFKSSKPKLNWQTVIKREVDQGKQASDLKNEFAQCKTFLKAGSATVSPDGTIWIFHGDLRAMSVQFFISKVGLTLQDIELVMHNK